MKRFLAALLCVLCCTLYAQKTYADWTLNIGYHNPPNATYGLNLLYFATKWAFEIGVGWAGADLVDTKNSSTSSNKNSKPDTATAFVSGDVNVKYFLTGDASLKPYLQFGMGTGLWLAAGKKVAGSGSIGGPFGGLGLMVGTPKLYVYGAGNTDGNDNIFFQGGIGFAI